MIRRAIAPWLFSKPLVAAINGAAAGLGFLEALYCDVRFSTPQAKFTTAFSRRGLIGEYGVAWLLPRIVGRSRALDILLSSWVIRGEEALQLGLADRVVAPELLLDAAVAYAEELANFCSPGSMRTIKRQLLHVQDSTFAEAVREVFRHTCGDEFHGVLACQSCGQAVRTGEVVRAEL